MVGARVQLRAGIGELTAVRGNLGADPAAQAKAAAGVEQAVAAVITEAERQRRDQERARVLDAVAAEHAAFVGREQLGAVCPGPLLLPDEVALPLDIAGEAMVFAS